MTIDERFERIEHVTAGLAEERCIDREEYHRLWRETQRQFAETNAKLAEANAAITRLAEESQAADKRLSDRIDQIAEELREVDRNLAARINGLVSAIGDWIARQPR